MDSPAANGSVIAEAGGAQMSFFQRLVGIYLEPTKTFEDISKGRTWLALFVLICIIALASNYVLQARMDPADMAVKGMAMMKPIMKKFMSPETYAKAEEQAAAQATQPRTTFAKVSPIIFTPLMMYIVYVILTTIFLIAFMITGAGLNFRKIFTAVIWGTGPPAIVVTLLSILFMYLKNPTDLEPAPVYNVISNLGLLADFGTHPALNSFLSSIDIFAIWTAFLLAVGLAAMSEKKLSVGKAGAMVVSLWAIWILLKVGFWAAIA